LSHTDALFASIHKYSENIGLYFQLFGLSLYFCRNGIPGTDTFMIITKEAFAQVYNDYFNIMCRFLNYYTHDVHAIEEVVQEVFVKLWTDHQGKKINFIKTYLYNSSRNCMLNYLRTQENRMLILEKWAQIEMEKKSATDCIDRDEFLLLLQAAVDSLPEKCKEIYILSREEELTYNEIARVKNLSVKTVEAQMGIALRRIREYIMDHSDETATVLLLLLKLF